jgi:hypothetical protein
MRCSEWLGARLVGFTFSNSENLLDISLALFTPSLILSR